MRKIFNLIIVTAFSAPALFLPLMAQTPVPVGAGGYAAAIPPEQTEFWVGKKVNVKDWHETVPLFLADGVKPPLPTNKWWSPLLFQNNVTRTFNLWAHPLNITVGKYGVGLHFPDKWTGILGLYRETMFLESPAPLRISGQGFAPAEQRVKSWGDWTVQFRVQESPAKYMDVTMGHGLPSIWVEYAGIANPQVNAPGATFFDDSGNNVSLPFTGDHVGISWEGRNYGLFAPASTTFANAGGQISLSIPSGPKYIVVSAMPSKDKLGYFHKYAYAVPRDSKMDFAYEREAGKVITNWIVKTQPMRGAETGVVQGWIPHHYRNSNCDFQFNGLEYPTARGKMKCAAGTSFRITYDFHGALTNLPVPEAPGFDRKRMDGYLDQFSSWNHPFNPETYAGGKQVAMFARQLANAKLLNHPKAAALQAKLRGELENFLTYTPGEPNKFFAYSNRFGGLIGFQCGFGSHRFNDQHFHYGYYVYAAGILSMYDKDFAAKYGEMAKLIAKEYANWDRADSRFPTFRTFDIWEGHSWASGGADNSEWFGENQESTSEAMMSWSAVITLGNALNDEKMTAAGVTGYVMEENAASEYWFNRWNENFPQAYGQPGRISCITWGNQLQYITYFGPEPIFVHGIQYLPVLPSSFYLVRNPEAAKTEFGYMLANSESPLYSRFKTRDSWEPQWANEAMRYASMFDPDWAVDWYEKLWSSKDAKASDAWESGLTYYFIYANKALGSIQWDSHIATPNSGVFYNPSAKLYTYCAYNPTASPQSYNVYVKGKPAGQLKVPANSFFSTHTLDGKNSIRQ